MDCIRSKIVKTRKEHKCFGCFSIIEIGSNAELNVNVCDGSIYHIYFCEKCLYHQEKYCNNCKDKCKDIEGFPEGYIKECEHYKK